MDRRSIALLACLIAIAFANDMKREFPRQRKLVDPVVLSSNVKNSSEYEIQWFTQTLDHFNYRTTPRTFSQRFLYADQYWAGVTEDGDCLGPIFFYTGNEGDITMFWENTGFVTQYLGPKYNALLIFAEHRYYGETLPFGQASYDPENLQYLSAEQALADYATLITSIKTLLKAERCPLISFGGSYGGMLSAWFRMKYPWHTDGSLAASAPILQFEGTGVSQWIFNEIITDDFAAAGTGCADNVRQGFDVINQYGATSSGLAQLSEIFKICQTMETQTDLNNFINWVESALQFLAMTDYPYPSNFLEPLPGWPINAFCDKMDAAYSGEDGLLENFANALAVYYNYTGQAGQCNNLNSTATPALGTISWDYQSCTEMVMPISSNGTSDMFPPSYFNETSWAEYCLDAYQVLPRPDWIPIYYGATNIEAASNIIFSNGMLDPWRGGGVQESLSDSLIAILIEDAAHHLDLRAPNPQDPMSVTAARQLEEEIISLWIFEAFEAKARK